MTKVTISIPNEMAQRLRYEGKNAYKPPYQKNLKQMIELTLRFWLGEYGDKWE